MESKASERIVWIDWAKSVGMFLVILGHCHIRENEQFVTQFIYSFHMPFFFFLSGLLCKRELSIQSIKKDIIFLIIPYITYGIIHLLCIFRFDIDYIVGYIISLFVGMDISIGPIWFLPALFICKQLYLFVRKTKVLKKWIYYSFLILSFFPSYFISYHRLNIPFFADSALCGMPFFIIGHESYSFIEKIRCMEWVKKFLLSIVLGCISLLLCKYNGYSNIAMCVVGRSIFVYYLVAFSAILSLSIICMMMNGFMQSYITVTSYGTIVTLGLHGIPLTLLNYYIPTIFGYELSVYSLYIALVYSIITYCVCYVMILFVARKCPLAFGIRPISFQ